MHITVVAFLLFYQDLAKPNITPSHSHPNGKINQISISTLSAYCEHKSQWANIDDQTKETNHKPSEDSTYHPVSPSVNNA